MLGTPAAGRRFSWGLWRRSGKRWLVPAGRLPLPVRPDPHPGHDGRGARTVHLRHLPVPWTLAWTLTRSCWPARRRGPAHSGLVLRAVHRAPRRTQQDVRTCDCRATRAPRPCTRFFDAAPFPAYPPRDSLQALQTQAERRRSYAAAARPDDHRRRPRRRRWLRNRAISTCSWHQADRLVVETNQAPRSLRLGAEAARQFDLDRVQFVETDVAGRHGLRSRARSTSLVRQKSSATRRRRARRFARLAGLARPGGVHRPRRLQHVRRASRGGFAVPSRRSSGLPRPGPYRSGAASARAPRRRGVRRR